MVEFHRVICMWVCTRGWLRLGDERQDIGKPNSGNVHTHTRITPIQSTFPHKHVRVRTFAVLVGEQPAHELGAVAALEVVLILFFFSNLNNMCSNLRVGWLVG